MNNTFYTLVDFLVTQFKAHPLVHTVVFGTVDVRDIAKQNIFPLVHIRPTGIDLGQTIITSQFEIAVINQRNTPEELQTSKLYSDNLVDNLNETYAILNSTIGDISNDNNDLDIDIISENKALPIIWSEKNTLDGWYTTIDVTIPNDDC